MGSDFRVKSTSHFLREWPERAAAGKLLKVVFYCAVLLGTSCRFSRHSSLDKAEEFLRQNKHQEAIDLYQAHMRERLAVKNRPEWENPYFYYLLIGDIELRRANVADALEAYYMAQQKGIHPTLISDRMRYVARWYEEQNKIEEAMAVLTKHRELDPLLFDAMLDRLSKDLIRARDNPEKREPNSLNN